MSKNCHFQFIRGMFGKKKRHKSYGLYSKAVLIFGDIPSEQKIGLNAISTRRVFYYDQSLVLRELFVCWITIARKSTEHQRTIYGNTELLLWPH